MKTYLLKRLGMMVPLLLGITLVTFLVMQLAPGRPTDVMTDMNPKMSLAAKERLTQLYGLDQPWHVQYARWLKRFIRLDFGASFKDDQPVLKKILERLPATLLLNVLSLALIFSLAFFLGLYSGWKRHSFFDHLTSLGVFIGFSTPTFWLALLLMILFGLQLGWLPISGLRSVNADEMPFWARQWDLAQHLFLPVLITALTGLASLSRYTRNATIQVSRQDFVRVARAKGLTERQILLRHVLPNTLIPVITILGLMLPDLIGGSFIFETIFAYPGMGRLGFDAVMARDYPMLMGIGTITALLTLIGNLLADLLYAWADPRIRLGKSA